MTRATPYTTDIPRTHDGIREGAIVWVREFGRGTVIELTETEAVVDIPRESYLVKTCRCCLLPPDIVAAFEPSCFANRTGLA